MSKKRKPFCDLSDRQKWRLVEREMNPNTAICSRATVSVPTPNHIMEKTSPIPVDNYVIDQGCDTATWLGSASSIGEHSTGTSLPAAHSQANSVNSETFSVYVKDIETNTYDSSSGLQEDLRTWVIKYSQIPRTAVNDLLALLRRNGHCDLPNDSRTLLSTPRNSANFIETFSSGRYAHFGVYEQLKDSIVKHYPKNQYPTEVNLLINIDGLPLSKSSAIQFWPILCAILSSEFYTTPFPIGIFEGNTKPDDVNQFLKKFVDETNTILQSSIILDHKTIVVKLHAIVCDAPAKAYVCGIKNHTGYFGCPKCIQQGEFIENRVVFTETSSSERTDASFKNRIHPEHHRETTALEKLPIGMVSQVGLDYMHLVCLGVMKRLLQFWVKGKLNIRLKPNKLEEASSKLISMRAYITLEFARQPRSLNEIDRWKATEFRQFLLYTGPIVMNNILSVKTYRHFMCLSVAIRILCDGNSDTDLIDYAHNLLLYFVRKYGNMYGLHYLSYNVHNLIHLAQDVKRLGQLENFSGFKFENYLYNLKRKLHISGRPLEQICNRIIEEKNHNRNVLQKYPILHSKLNVIYKAEFESFTLTTTAPNSYCILYDGRVVNILKISQKTNVLCFTVNTYKTNTSFFSVPCKSESLGILYVADVMEDTFEIPFSDIKNKCMCLKYLDGYVVMPYLH
ncbi:uncharacterized protein LOC116180936 [Photinus pyralis]|uniref:uncharacterized protein LOC116180936 n=1 Tax=Photinus pyralis TaxID=7054 RepID=UPI0012674FFC|nr:uncharacterized protein LOC116180936 [Photinus pyralis]